MRAWCTRAVLASALLCGAAVPAAAQVCVGDCDGDGRVSIAELVVGVNIVLGLKDPAVCPAFAVGDGAGAVEVSALVTGVRNSLDGCPPGPTPTLSMTAERFLGSVVAPLLEVVRVGASLPPAVAEETIVACAFEGSAAIRCEPLGDGHRWMVSLSGCVGGFDGEASVELDGDMFTDSLAECSEGPSDILAVGFEGTATLGTVVETFSVWAPVVEGRSGSLSGGLMGTVTADCLGGEISLSAQIGSLFIEPLAACPTAGMLEISRTGVFEPGQFSRLTFTAGEVGVDVGGDGVVDAMFDSCGDPAVERCP